MLVKFRAGTSAQSSKSVHGRRGGELVKEFPRLRLHHVKLKKGVSVEEALKEYQAEPEVEYAEPNYLYSIQQQPDDPRFPEQWALQNLRQEGGTLGADTNAINAWAFSTGSSDVVVAVLDTGIDYNHEDLSANVWMEGSYNAVDPSSTPFDDNGHGTHAAGIIGARGSNGIGVAGLNWNVKLAACKFLDASGSGDTAGAIQCLEHVKGLKDAGANVVATNNSWSGFGFSQALYDAINAQQDILFIAAAGNDGTDNDVTPSYPASYDLPNVIAVAATNRNDEEPSFSNHGRHTVHLAAPGVDILSTLPAQNVWSLAGGYGKISGTSMAAPHVAGIVALVKAQRPTWQWHQLRNLILAGGDNVEGLAGNTVTGKRVNALGSMSCSQKPMLIPLKYPESFPFTSGTYTLSALSINCADPAGPVTVTSSAGDTITLHDDGVFPDLAAGDGIFTATWTVPFYFLPKPVQHLKFSSPSGDVYVPSLATKQYLPEGNLHRAYSQYLQAVAGTGPYTWTVSSGALPDGLALNTSSGLISGYPLRAGTYAFSVQITDATGRTDLIYPKITVASDYVYEDGVITYFKSLEVHPTGIALDAGGNTYLTGAWTPYTVTDPDHYMTAKFSPSGALLWSRSYSLSSAVNGWAEGIALDSGGNAYVTGGYPDPNSLNYSSAGSTPFTTVKYDPQGNQIWNRDFAEEGKVDLGTSVALDPSGNLYVAGYGTTYVDDYSDDFLIKYDSAGNVLWSRGYDSAEVDKVFAIATDASGNAYLAGRKGWRNPNGSYTYQRLILKYSPEGTLLWEKTLSDDVMSTIVTGTDGSVYVGSGELLKYDPAGGVAWTKPIRVGGAKGPWIMIDSLVIGKQGHIYAGGTFFNGSDSVCAVAKLDADGNVLWTKQISGEIDAPVKLALDGSGALHVSRSWLGGMLVTVLTEYLVVEPPPVGVMGKSYSAKVQLNGGAAPYTVSLAGGGLPPGLTIDPVTQTISGTPTASGNFYFTLQLQDATGARNLSETVLQVYEPLEVTFTDRGTGRVDFSNGASYSGPCSLSFAPGMVVTMSAVAGAGSVFTGWTGACSGTNVCTVTMDGSKSVGAGFKKLTATLTVSRPSTLGSGTVQFSPGVSCTGSCLQVYDFGTDVTLTAVPAVGSVFAGWAGACSGVSVCTLPMTADRLVFAKFQPAGPELPLIASGVWHGAVLRGDGTISTWGDNVDGALGDGTVGYRTAATANPVLTGAVSVDAFYDTLALKEDGTVWSWGKNNAGQLGDGTTINQPAPRQVSGLSGVTRISAGSSHSVAVKSDGTVWAWGSNGFGDFGDGTTTSRATPVQALGITGGMDAAAGGGFTLALKSDGTVWAWGENIYAQLGDNTLTDRLTPVQTSSLTGVVAIAAGDSYGVALKGDGTVWTWGSGSLGKLGTGSTTNSKVPAKVTSLSGIVAIAAGSSHTLALKSDGTVWAWGYNPSGNIGDGTTTQRNTPVQVPGLTGVVRIAARDYHSYAVKSDGTVWGWGGNTRGSLGDGTTDPRYSPRQLSIPSATLSSDFTGSASSGPAPLTVSFSDLSTGAPTSWLWNFGDGATANEKNPVHVYSTPGSYTVSLTATNQTGSSTKTKADYISVLTCTNPPVRVQSSPTVLFADPFAAFLQAIDDDVVQLQGVPFAGDLIFDREIRVRLQGGYDCAYNATTGSAALTGNVKVTRGTVKLDGIRLK
ncbi:S8 family serine peptidase [Geomonas oryzisoli]|uniref:S8 family serine peptidase n=1 Tax=Geomonas oryzisoli TaxID=2847992 RepID=A0ABX8JB56_9BACT|nr:S8 family serine peptidase [Geomonas oryzisoli]QWV94814.1 S8 family serine peptidase [Geomonas oryzisoli]